MDITYFWTGWTPIVHTALVATVGYLALVLLVRGTGPRTMAKMTPLDFAILSYDGEMRHRALRKQVAPHEMALRHASREDSVPAMPPCTGSASMGDMIVSGTGRR